MRKCCSTQAVNNPLEIPTMKKGISGATSCFQDNLPRFHQKTTSNAAGKVAMTDFEIQASNTKEENQ